MSETQVKVLIVEDEESFVEALSAGLKQEGFLIQVARDGDEAFRRFNETSPDLVLLDLILPRTSGVDVCKKLRLVSRVPIIMVTAKGTEIDTVVGLEVGADDYVSKPFRLRELIARMRAVIRRTNEPFGAKAPSGMLSVGSVTFDASRHEVYVNGEFISLPLKEFEILGLLIANAGHVISRQQIVKHVWGRDYIGETKSLDVHIKRLRMKIEDSPERPIYIKTVRGLGYKFESQESLN